MPDDGMPEIRSIHFDPAVWHPLDHSILHCQYYPGGRRQHLQYQWVFVTRPWLLAHTKCLIKHTPGDAWRGKGANARHFTVCCYCRKVLDRGQLDQ